MPVPLIDLVRAKSSQGFEREVGSRGQFQGPCPACGGTDRFVVFPDQEPAGDLAVRAGAWGGFWCNQCRLAGDYVQWLKEVEGWDWMKIFEFLGVDGERDGQNRVSHTAPTSIRREHRVGRDLSELLSVEFPSKRWREHACKLVEESAKGLERNPKLVEWLERRGVSLELARKFKLGWHPGAPQKGGRPPCAYRSREGWGLEAQLNERGRRKAIWIPRGLIIPNFRDGEILAVRIRRPTGDVSDGQKKYILVAGSTLGCMITPTAKAYVVVEAALDGMAIMAAKVEGVGMCVMGSLSAYPDKEAAKYLSKATDILQALDFEPQGNGEKQGNKFRHWWGVRFPQCRRTPMPVGKDPGELVEQIGLQGLRTWIESQVSPSVHLAAPPPKGKIIKAPPKEDPRLPDAIQELYGLLVSTGGCLMTGHKGAVLGSMGLGGRSLRASELAMKPVVNKWLALIKSEKKKALKVTAKVFMQPVEEGK